LRRGRRISSNSKPSGVFQLIQQGINTMDELERVMDGFQLRYQTFIEAIKRTNDAV